MSVVGKYDPKTRRYKIDTEAGDKIARAIAYTTVAGTGGAIGAVGAGNAAIALSAAAGATAVFYTMEKRPDTAMGGRVEIIRHEAPDTHNIAQFLPQTDRDEIARISATMQKSTHSTEKRTMDNLPEFQRTGDLSKLGLNIRIEQVDSPESPGKNHQVNACMARPKAPRNNYIGA